jgi:Tol biopolymer transport system component
MLQVLIGCLFMIFLEPAGDSSPTDWWIGYSESRNDLPEGQFANGITRRAYVVRADGSQRRAIGSELADKENSWTQFAGWSPDGRHAIVYRSWEDPANAQWEREHKTFRMTEGWLVDSCLVDIRNDSIKNLTANDRVSLYNTGLFFLPDGKGYGFTALINGISKPFQMDLDGGNKRDVSGGGTGFSYGYSASPDGSRISYHEDYQVYIANADGTGKQRIETGNAFNFVPQWSPDGQWLMFLSGEHYNCHPHIVEKDGTGLRKLADRGGYRGVVEVLKHPDFHSESSDVPVWAPDSQSIYYTSKIGDSIELMRADLEGYTNRLTHSPPKTRHYHPAVSPNGKWILFGSDQSGTMQLYVAEVDSKAFDATSVWPVTHVDDWHCAMHGYWQPVAHPHLSAPDPEIVTVAKSASDYTRKSEGDVIELADGRLLLVYMEFAGDGSDFAKTRLVAQESSDGGRRWGKHRVITETASGDLNVYSPSLIRARDGGILLVFMRQHRPGTLTNHVWKSTDEGETFTPLSEFVPRQDFSLCNGTIKRLTSGRLLLPASPPQPGNPAETGPYSATTLYSDDDGLTWHVSPSRIALPKRGAMEPHVEETGDGRVLMVMRNQLGKIYFSESSDEGATWSEPWASELITPESCPELTRIPGTGDLLMIWNHQYDASFRSHYGKRSPLTCAISKDDGKTWQSVRDIEADPSRAFSNPSCRFTRDGKAIVNYWTCEYLPDWRMQDVIDLRVALIDTAWFYGGKSSK